MILLRKEERDAAEKKRKRLLTFYIVAACLYVAAVLLLLFLSPDGYVPYLIGNILLSVLFGFGSIYFFTVPFEVAVKRYKLLNKVTNALVEREYGVFLREEEGMTIDGVPMRILLFLVRGNERELHLFESDFAFEEGKKYLLEVRAAVVTEASLLDE